MIKVTIPILLAISLICTLVYVSADADIEIYDASRGKASIIQEIKAFLIKDEIDTNDYNPWKYTCVNFATDLWRNAYLAGFRVCIVIVEDPNIAVKGLWYFHALVGFYVIDEPDEFEYDKFYITTPLDKIILTDPINSGDTISDPNYWEILAIFDGKDAFELWREKSGKTLNKGMLFRLYVTVGLYKIGELFS